MIFNAFVAGMLAADAARAIFNGEPYWAAAFATLSVLNLHFALRQRRKLNGADHAV